MKLLFTTHTHITDVLSRKSLKDYYYYFYYYCYVHWKCEISWRILFPLFFPKKGNKKIQWCCPAFTPLYFLLAPIIAYISSGPFAWHDRIEIKPSNIEGKSSGRSFHLWAALLNISIHMSLTSPNHRDLFLVFPLTSLPCLSPLGKLEEVYGVCAAEKHWKGLTIFGKRPGS